MRGKACTCHEGEVPFQVVGEDGAGLYVDVRRCDKPDCPYREDEED